MAQTVKQLQGDRIVALDGAIGEVADVYFDDQRWAVRYLVVDAGFWLPGRRVLVSPSAIRGAEAAEDGVRVNLTREQMKNAPGADTRLPVSRQQEIAHAAHFGYPYYWSGPLLWGAAAYPVPPAAPPEGVSPEPANAERAVRGMLENADSHLRSAAAVIGYAIEAHDGAIGTVEDLVVDDRTWAIRELVVDTRKWWPGGRVRVSPDQVSGIDWAARKVHLRTTRERLRAAAAA